MNYRPNSRFAEHVTSIAFHISLSRNMCSLLLAIDAEQKRKKGEWYESETSGYGNFIPTVRSLESRGLVEFREPPVNKHGIRDVKFKTHVLTEEGKLMAELIRRAGISEETVKRGRKIA